MKKEANSCNNDTNTKYCLQCRWYLLPQQPPRVENVHDYTIKLLWCHKFVVRGSAYTCCLPVFWLLWYIFYSTYSIVGSSTLHIFFESSVLMNMTSRVIVIKWTPPNMNCTGDILTYLPATCSYPCHQSHCWDPRHQIGQNHQLQSIV